MRTLRLEYQPLNSKLWLIIGDWIDGDIEYKDALYRQIDGIAGTLRVLEVKTGIVVFQRPTAVTPTKETDDCHTYDH